MSPADHTDDRDKAAAELQRSLDTFSAKVDENYRSFYAETPLDGVRQRSLFHLWLARCGIGVPQHARKRKR